MDFSPIEVDGASSVDTLYTVKHICVIFPRTRTVGNANRFHTQSGILSMVMGEPGNISLPEIFLLGNR